MPKLGYLIPEFPGQTHMFFWRERRELQRLGVQVDLVSTRPPPAQLLAHEWAAQAVRETVYLAPPGAGGLAAAGWELLRAGPQRLRACLDSLFSADGLTLRGRLRLLGLLALGGRVVRLARQRGWTHLHCHSAADSAHIALFAHLLSGLPYSLTLHNPLAVYGANQRQKWQHARYGVVISQKLRGELEGTLAGSLPPTVEIAPMGVDLERFVRADAYQPWSGEGQWRIFACGRLNPVKGHNFLIEAIGRLRATGVDARLVIAGEEERPGAGYRRQLESQIAEARLEGAVTLLGAVGEERVRAELEKAHVFALASLSEGVPVAVMEAMALGAPVVVTAVDGVPELVEDGVDGLLVAPRDVSGMAAGIERLVRDPALVRRLTAAARKKVESSFSAARSAEVIARLSA